MILQKILCYLLFLFFLSYSGWHFLGQISLKHLVIQLDSSLNHENLTEAFLQNKKLGTPAAQYLDRYYRFRHEVSQVNCEEASKQGQALFEELPAFYDLEYQIAILNLQCQSPAKALEWIERAIDAHPLEESNYFVKADILKRLQRLEEASQSKEQGRKIMRRNMNFRSVSE